MSTVIPNQVRCTVPVPGYEGPFVLDVPTLDANVPGTHAKAARRAMWSLIAAGYLDVPAGASPDDVLATIATEYR